MGELVGFTVGLGEALTVGVVVMGLLGVGVVVLAVGEAGLLVAVGTAFLVGTKVLLGVAMVGSRGMVGEMKIILMAGSSGSGVIKDLPRISSPERNTTKTITPTMMPTAAMVRLRSSIVI